MNYPSIRIEGAILSPDILSQIEELPGQKPSDFGLDSGTKVKDEIARAWADAQDYWRIFQRKLESVKPGSNATTETRNLWMVPLLGLLRYDLEYQPRGSELNGRIYAISHRVTNRAGASVQIVGYRDPAGLDKKPANAARRMSAHAMVQEFLNLDDQLYGLVADGHVLRLLRDSSRLVKLSYLEFDLDRIFTDGLYADFAVLYRLLHATRLPLTDVSAAESLIERYHQDSLDSGARIRAGLSKAVEHAILDFGNGFVAHAENEVLRASIFDGSLSADAFYQQLLRLIYRLLFLMVIEERGLVFPQDVSKAKRDVYRNYYSVARLRRLSEKKYLADPRRNDLWQGLQASFSLFEADGRGQELGIAPLAGDLFSQAATNALEGCTLGNDVLLGCLCALGLYRHPDSGQIIRVNYAALNVEEFGSVYEGLLEFEPEFISEGLNVRFAFRQGEARAATGSHYTPDELVQPLIRHSLDCLIAERLKTDDPEAALLDLRVADIACGSGHILLAAARRIATELATVRTGEEQPSPSAYRTALRDAIRTCIYGVDLNPLAVELCKVALWLEAHIPGQPLYFLDHHIKCGNAIVGFARREEVGRSIPTEAFNALAGDDKDVASTFRKKNKEDLKHHQQTSMEFTPQLRGHFVAVLDEWRLLSALPELTPAQIKDKKKRFGAFVNGTNADLLRTIADVPVAQFFLPKTTANEGLLVTDAEFRGWWRGERAPRGAGALAAKSTGKHKRFFHWFLEFPQIIEKGGFDCILGNPPYLGGKKISGTHGATLLDYLKATYSNTGGLCDLVTYFLRRAAQLLNRNGYLGLITTNSLSEGDTRTGGLQQLLENGAEIRFAVSSMRWPGTASLQVSLVAMSMVPNSKPRLLNGREVEHISSMFDADVEMPDPIRLQCMAKRSFVGTIVSGKGFVLSPEEATEVASIGKNGDVIRTYLSGSDLTSSPTLAPSRYVIDFGDRTRSEAEKYLEPFAIVEERVYPERKSVKKKVYRDNWWRFAEPQTRLYAAISKLDRVIAIPQTAKWLTVSFVPRGPVYAFGVAIIVSDLPQHLAVLQSTVHYEWARRYTSTLETRMRYTPSDVFETFPMPSTIQCAELGAIGERYHGHRAALMRFHGLGLTKVYNLFHSSELNAGVVARVVKQGSDAAASGYVAMIELRNLHAEMDIAVRDAYGWHDLSLEHDFYEVEGLPENDCVRYTISPAARREILKRLLDENHRRASQETNNSDMICKQTRGNARRKPDPGGPSLFPEEI